MKRILIFIGIYIIVKFIFKLIVKVTTKPVLIEPLGNEISDNTSKEVIENQYNKRAGYKLKKEQIDFPNLNAQVTTRNMFIESHNELNLSLLGTDITAKEVNEAYEKELNKHMDNISKGIPDNFNISLKKEARDYLLAYLSNSDDNK